MKKIWTIIFLAASLSGSAQDLEFLGISLEQSKENIHDELLRKGMVDRPSRYDGEYSMTGTFWKFTDCDIFVYGAIGSIVGVRPPSWTTVNTMNDLISSLTRKYGSADASQSDDFHQEFIWYVGESCIVITDFYIETHNYYIAYMSRRATQDKIASTKNYDSDL